jgi:hypothetical protein
MIRKRRTEGRTLEGGFVDLDVIAVALVAVAITDGDADLLPTTEDTAGANAQSPTIVTAAPTPTIAAIEQISKKKKSKKTKSGLPL